MGNNMPVSPDFTQGIIICAVKFLIALLGVSASLIVFAV